MVPLETTSRPAVGSGGKTLVLLALLSLLVILGGERLSPSLQGTDFVDFYTAARMLAAGHGHQLYDADAQREYQARYSGRVGTLYIHPPFEAVAYLAVAWLPLRRAYLLWWVLNLGVLALAARRLTTAVAPQYHWRTIFVVALTFVPVLLALIQGQDSLLLLLVVVFAFTNLRSDHAFAAGCWMGLGLFKFQLALPLFFMCLFSQNTPRGKQLIKGFSLVALVLTLLSAAISGWSVFTIYPSFLRHLREQPFAGVFPQAMANLRGLLFLALPARPSAWVFTAIVILSAAAVLKVMADWRRVKITSPSSSQAFDLAFATAVVCSLLVSYHLNPHDLSLLLLPLFLLLRYDWSRTSLPRTFAWWLRSSLLAILLLPPLHLWALRAHRYALLAIPVLMLFLTSGPQEKDTAISRP